MDAIPATPDRSQRAVSPARTDVPLDGALRAMTDAVAIVDRRGVVIFLNPTAAHLTGWPERESLGRPLAQVVHFADAQGRTVDVLAAEGHGMASASLLLRRDGHAVLVDGDVAAVFDANGVASGAVLTFRNVTAAKRLTDELTWQATHDPLTGLANRRAFESRLKRAVATAAQQGCCHALLYIDLDRFKAVNDAGGHVAGDELLRQLAALLRRSLREHDMVCRLGGDEFALLAEDCTEHQAAQIAEKLRTSLADFSFAWQGLAFQVGASIGLVTFANGRRSPADLLRRADALCYRAKSAGRGQVIREPRRDTPPMRPARSLSPRERRKKAGTPADPGLSIGGGGGN